MQFISEVKRPFVTLRKQEEDVQRSEKKSDACNKKKKRYVFMFLRPTHFFVFKTTEETERNVHTC